MRTLSARPVDPAGNPSRRAIPGWDVGAGLRRRDTQILGGLAGLMTKTDELGGLQFLEVRSTLPDELLMYADKLSMAHGLELRVPFIDKEIVEYVERLPATFKVRNGSRKWLHRQVCRSYLPDSVLKRQKRGFAVNVVDDWFRDAIEDKMTSLCLIPDPKFINTFAPRRSANFSSGTPPAARIITKSSLAWPFSKNGFARMTTPWLLCTDAPR